MSVRFLSFTAAPGSDPSDIYPYGYAFTSSDLDDAVKSLSDLLPQMLKLAECEKSASLWLLKSREPDAG